MSTFENYPRISPFLWFDANAEEAVDFYLSVFKNGRKISTARRKVDDPSGPKGTVLTVSFELEGMQMTALNGGLGHSFNEAVSFVVRCDSQQEIDQYWDQLIAGGRPIACGWLRDKFGLCWQVVPAILPKLIEDPRAMQAMLKMQKLDIAELERAARS